MLAHPTKSPKLPNTAVILKPNFRRSHNVTYSIFNNPNIINFLFLALQEPPINSRTNMTSNQVGWKLITHCPSKSQESSRPRSCLYINMKTDPIIQPIHSLSRDLSACTIKIQDQEVLLINVYNQPKMFLGFSAMDTALRELPTPILLLPTILVTKSKLNSPIWNPDTYAQYDADTEKLVEAMTNWCLYLRFPEGTPKYMKRKQACSQE